MSLFTAIRDPSLRLAVVETLARARKLDLGGVPRASKQDRVDPKTLNALLTLEVPDAALAGISELWWEAGGHKIQHQIWPLWHGEDDTFYVHSLAGIEALSGLKKLVLATDADLRPLLPLKALKSVRLQLADAQHGSPVPDELRARGVDVHVELRLQVLAARKPLKLPKP